MILPPPPASHGLEIPHYGCEIKLVPRCCQRVSGRAMNHRSFPQIRGTADFGAKRANRSHFSKTSSLFPGFPHLRSPESVGNLISAFLRFLWPSLPWLGLGVRNDNYFSPAWGGLIVAGGGCHLRASASDSCSVTPWFWPQIESRQKISGPKFALARPPPFRESGRLREWQSVGCGPPP